MQDSAQKFTKMEEEYFSPKYAFSMHSISPDCVDIHMITNLRGLKYIHCAIKKDLRNFYHICL